METNNTTNRITEAVRILKSNGRKVAGYRVTNIYGESDTYTRNTESMRISVAVTVEYAEKANHSITVTAMQRSLTRSMMSLQ